ncbi:hypothetical protein BZA05DRAFT_30743 [Tricharina praecox]|uniref:uncharacterized protein n=1 Tax=Tricharina praecox TaxID=43433 RepID=UPI00221F60DA|nr:uncharacterized protein BZA05DRAFT_30743 [Tricharina praecox]KAI5853480.1 hypothetical protein BZA05DRAFT_30743 [Tricharina praecox]
MCPYIPICFDFVSCLPSYTIFSICFLFGASALLSHASSTDLTHPPPPPLWIPLLFLCSYCSSHLLLFLFNISLHSFFSSFFLLLSSGSSPSVAQPVCGHGPLGTLGGPI